MIDWLARYVLAWTTGAALTLTLAQIVAPSFMDWILDFLVVLLVWVAAKLSEFRSRS